jgi:uncharacterized C2H2 Zn-finger protein
MNIEDKVQSSTNQMTTTDNDHNESTSIVKIGKQENKVRCRKCDQVFRSKQVYVEHLAAKHSIQVNLSKCDKCNQSFTRRVRLTAHINKHHRTDNKVMVSEQSKSKLCQDYEEPTNQLSNINNSSCTITEPQSANETKSKADPTIEGTLDSEGNLSQKDLIVQNTANQSQVGKSTLDELLDTNTSCPSDSTTKDLSVPQKSPDSSQNGDQKEMLGDHMTESNEVKTSVQLVKSKPGENHQQKSALSTKIADPEQVIQPYQFPELNKEVTSPETKLDNLEKVDDNLMVLSERDKTESEGSM